MNKSTKLYILYGGPSSEREVSFSSKKYFEKLYSEYSPILVEWLENFDFKVGSKLHSEAEFYENLSAEDCIVIIASHGEYVEDGYIQKKFEECGIKYTGSDSKSCKLAMDKAKSQKVASKICDVKFVPTYSFSPKAYNYDKTEVSLGKSCFPLFLKPNNLGSSVGMYLVNNKKELEEVVKTLPDISYLAQPKIDGVELSVGTVRDGDDYLDLPPTEIRPILGEFFTWDAKYKVGGSEELTPATVGLYVQEKVKNSANAVHNALGLGYYSRSDFIFSDNDEIYYLETNPLPGMSSTSLLPQQLEVSKNISAFKKGLLQNLC